MFLVRLILGVRTGSLEHGFQPACCDNWDRRDLNSSRSPTFLFTMSHTVTR